MMTCLIFLFACVVHIILDITDLAPDSEGDVSGAASGISIILDIIQALGIFMIILMLYYNHRVGIGHPWFVRQWVAFNALANLFYLFSVVQDGRSWYTIVYEIVSIFLLCILSWRFYLAWKNPKLENVGHQARPPGSRNVPSWEDFWPLMSEFKYLLFTGFLGSICQAASFNFSIMLSANLMKGGALTTDQLNQEAMIFLMLSMSVALFRCFCQNMYGLVGQKVTLHIKRLMFANFLAQDATFLHQKANETGTLVARLNTDTEVFGAVLTLELQEMMRPFFQTALGIIILFVLDWRLSLVFCCMLVFLNACMLARSVVISAALSRKYSDRLAALSARGLETLKGIDCVHQYQQEANELTVYNNYLLKTFDVAREKVLKESWFKGYEAILLASIQAVTFWYGGQLVLDENNPLDGDRLLAFSLVAAICVKGCEDLDKGVPIFLAAAGSAVRVCEKIYAPYASQENTIKKYWKPEKDDPQQGLIGHIEFKDVCFRYPGSTEDMMSVLGPGLNFSIKAGESCAFVGESGCGKSTTIALISRDYHVGGLDEFKNPIPHDHRDAGRVYLDGRDIRDYDRSWLLEQIGVVAQKSVIFNTSVEENVAYGQASHRFHTEEEKNRRRPLVIEALRKAAAYDEFINNETNKNNLGLDYICGQDGCNLSGGQKQRVSIARMIYKKPTLFIFDEVTSALDAGSERKVMATLIAISQGKTNFLVAHRLATIKHANNIIVFRKGGTIIESAHHSNPSDEDGGKAPEGEDPRKAHDKLMANRDAYYTLVSNQTFE
jgi:ATP-binding cassette subfamily B (MDR/TAP) protein 1